jgi:hypothetical protein
MKLHISPISLLTAPSSPPSCTSLTLLPWTCRQEILPKHCYLSTKIHNVTSPKTVIFIATAMGPWNLTMYWNITFSFRDFKLHIIQKHKTLDCDHILQESVPHHMIFILKSPKPFPHSCMVSKRGSYFFPSHNYIGGIIINYWPSIFSCILYIFIEINHLKQNSVKKTLFHY